MTHAAQSVKMLIQGMAADRQHYQALTQLLEAQREHILARHASELDALNTQVMACYQQLSSNSQQRYRLLNQLGIPATAEGMLSLISRLPASHRAQVSTLWQTLQQQASQCFAANEYNGSLMSMQQEILLNVLNASEPENWLYQQG